MARRVAFRKKRQNRLGMALVSFVVLMLMAVILFMELDLRERKIVSLKDLRLKAFIESWRKWVLN